MPVGCPFYANLVSFGNNHCMIFPKGPDGHVICLACEEEVNCL